MTNMTVYLPKLVKQRAEDFIRQNNPKMEHGGYFLGQGSTLLIPRFYPNRSDRPEHSYKRDASAIDFVRLDARLFGMDLLVDFHTHPNHSITSEQDLKYAGQQPLAKINVMIGYNAGEDAFTWHAYDNSALEVPVIVVTEEYPVFRELFAQSLRLTPLGDCFLTPEGELLANNTIAKVVVDVDAEGLRVYNYFMAKQHESGYSWCPKSKTRIAQDLGMTPDRLQKIVARLQERGVKGLALPKSRGSGS